MIKIVSYNRIKSVCAVVLTAFLILSGTVPAFAEVLYFKNAGGDEEAVYIAGNPDAYPVEYYNPYTRRYEGIIPELLKRISASTGVKFAYIHTGKTDYRGRLAKNGQVEIVSGYRPGKDRFEKYLSGEAVVLSVPVNGKVQNVGLAFTYIASEEFTRFLSEELAGFTEEELLDITISVIETYRESTFPMWAVTVMVIMLILATIVIILMYVQQERYMDAQNKGKYQDPTTGIGNKAYFMNRFDYTIRDEVKDLYYVAYIAFDIIHNNTYYGYDESEEILCYAADYLSEHEVSNEILGRVSAGGFAFAFQSSNTELAEQRVAELLMDLNQYSEKFQLDHKITFAAGVYPMTKYNNSCETVLYFATQGYEYAVGHQLPYYFCSEAMLKYSEEIAQRQKQIVMALRNHEFKMYLQFIVDKDGNVFGAEGLSRWQHPQKGLLTPGHFIDIIEKSGTVSRLDYYMFEEACSLLQSWKTMGFSELSLSCNVTRITISDSTFMAHIRRIAEKYDFDHSKLIFEITESTSEKNADVAAGNIMECRKEGFCVALDNMGGDNTSFLNLCDYPADYMKINWRILKAAVTPKGKALLDGMIALAHSMDMKVVCEGVENEELNELAHQTDCDFMQGHYFFRTIPPEAVEEFFTGKIEKTL